MRSSVNRPATAGVFGVAGVMILSACAADPSSDVAGRGGSSATSSSPTDSSGVSGAAGRESVAPTLSKLAYLEDEEGLRIVGVGLDPDERLESVWLSLLDEQGAPASIPAGDGSTEPSELEILASSMDRGLIPNGFFFEVRPAKSLANVVRRVAARTQDKRGVYGEPESVALSPIAVHSAGEACDLLGFDRCASQLACVAASRDAARCVTLDAARTARCSDAPLLVVAESSVVLDGVVSPGTSLWDPVDGCASAERRGRPEAAVRLRLSRAVRSVTVATDPSGTSFDTVVSVLDRCDASPKTLVCNDDDPAPTSRAVMDAGSGLIAAGDYFVVVDSLERVGGTFRLVVTPTP